ncbi:MAG: preprotein translocase subunit YajC [Saprospiraceae bacterium]
MELLIFKVLLLQAGGAGTMNLVFFGAMLLIFWLFMIRPQMKRQREQRAFMDGLQRGDEVVTASGMLGKITKMDGEIVTLEVSPKTFVRVTKSAISKELTEGTYAAKNKPTDDKDRKSDDQATTEGG